MPDWTQISEHISVCTHENFGLKQSDRLSGGSINAAWCLTDGKRRFFVKLNTQYRQIDMFAAEQAGLLALYRTGAIKVPTPVCFGTTETCSYLVTEYLSLRDNVDQRKLGQQLAQLHRHTETHYGWERDNTLGTTPQPNTPTADWLTFWRNCRLGHQLNLAASSGYGNTLQKTGEQLLSKLDHFLATHRPPASLLHGDLWSGNVAALADGTPVIYDPAVYYGDRETDLAMTELFGGFGHDFYAVYREQWALDDGYVLRRDLYNLYYVLNHLNLFGGGYLSQAQHLINKLLAEVS